MEENFDYLDVSDTAALNTKNLRTMGEHLKELKLKMLEAEAAFDAAKKEYDYYASSVLPMEMFNAGFTELKLASGEVMRYDRKFYCKPNKNDDDKRVMAEWLRKHGGDELVKEKASVDKAYIDKLKENGVPFVEIDDINTNSLKAFLKDKIGANGGLVQVQIDEIPACMHFQEVGEVSIDI